MAFVDWILNNPGYTGVESTSNVGAENRPAVINSSGIAGTNINTGSLDVFLSPLYNPDNTAINGWQTVGGPGGSARPTTGMMYPRGQG